MRVAVVILNWNTRDYLKRFIPGVLASLGKEDILYVADSGSRDGSIQTVESLFPQVRIISIGENLGFTGGYNYALSQIDAQYYLLLNSDIEVTDNWLEILSLWMETHPECGICAPKLHALDKVGENWQKTQRFEYAGAAGGYLDYFGYPYCRGRILSRVELDRGQYDTPSRVFWVSGAALMIRSSVWHNLGGFDERFFAHMEEIDLCWRAQSLGYQIWCVPQSLVYHIGGGTLPANSPFKLRLNFRNSLWMLKKNLPFAIGPVRARIRIFCRCMMDWGVALAYLIKGKKEYAESVAIAHKEVRKSSRMNFKGKYKIPPDGGLLIIKYLSRR